MRAPCCTLLDGSCNDNSGPPTLPSTTTDLSPHFRSLFIYLDPRDAHCALSRRCQAFWEAFVQWRIGIFKRVNLETLKQCLLDTGASHADQDG